MDWDSSSLFRFSEESTDDDSGLYSAVFVLRSPYLAVESSAVTDDPIEVDIASQQFIKSLSKIRELTFYDITADTKFVDLEESEAEEVEELPEEQIPEGEEVTQDVEELVEK